MAALRNIPTSRRDAPANWAEWLLSVGKFARKQIRRGAGIEEVATRLEIEADTCKLAVVFYESSDTLKLRAIVEDWTWARLVSELAGAYRIQRQPEPAAV
jgi:hypothetical protein